jgi:hydrogenase-4 transcriptional activator
MTTKYSDFDALLLRIWREVACHLRIEEATAAILPQLQAAFGVRGLMVRRLDTVRRRVETLVSAGMSTQLTADDGRLEEAQWSALLQWCGTATPIAEEASRLVKRLPGLLPRNLPGKVWVGCLEQAGQPRGLLILDVAACPDEVVLSACFSALLEPFAAALENDRRLRELSVLREAAEADRQSLLTRLKRQDVTDTPVGAESGLREVMQRVDLVARSDTPVLILGETGSGKEVIARAIHRRSPRSAGPFLRVNCGAIPPELIDSELFGHERGSFTGAVSTRQGWFERADGGTLFLDEIGELSPAAQVRLLRVLQDGSVQRVGGQRTLVVDVRVVAATHRDLHAMVTQGAFRQDLWYRIAIFPIRLPALRERTQDIPALATHFALQAAQRLGLAPQVPRPEDMALLVDYPWPGNVRELAAVMERAAILGDGRRLEVAQALGVGKGPLFVSAPSSARKVEPAAVDSLDEHNRRHIEAVLASCAGRVDGPFGAARRLGINPNTLRGRMRKLGIDPRRFRQRL